MARHRKAAPAVAASRHARDLALLRAHARPAHRALAAIPAVAPPPPAPSAPPVRWTLNWQAGPDDSVLVPRRLAPEELPELAAPAVRALIDVTAQGLPTPPELRQQLLAVDLATLQAAISEGIHRWHTYR